MTTGKSFVLAAALCFSLTAQAAFKNVETIYENNFTASEIDARQLEPDKRVQLPREGEKGDGALWIRDPKFKFNNVYSIRLSPQLFADGGYFALEGIYRGENLECGERHYYHAGLSLAYKLKSSGDKTFWAGSDLQLGTSTWTQNYAVVKLPPGEVTEMTIFINNHMGSGDYYVDKVKLSKAVEIPDGEVMAPVNKEAQGIRKGRDIFSPDSLKNYSGPLAKQRGVQVCSSKITPADIDDLGKWGANIVRFCFNDSRNVSDAEDYAKLIDEWIERLDSLLPAFQRNGIKVVVCVSTMPGAKKTIFASLDIAGGADFAALEKAWTKIATHYRGNPSICGYDLLNEPFSLDTTAWDKVSDKLVQVVRAADPKTAIIISYPASYKNGIDNIVYSPHFYSPHSLTHQGVGGPAGVAWSYPGYINGVYWDKEQLRVQLKPIIEFQQQHNAQIFIGEFSCVVWAKGSDQYVKDCVELFEEYGWDWTYHAFREWPPWSVEYERDGDFKIKKAEKPTPRLKTLQSYFELNAK